MSVGSADGDLQAAWARLLIDSLSTAGVCDVVISPGSRSTPLVLAAIAHPALRCHDVVDERSAGFFALGQGKATGRPTLLVCTSGSAGAHYLPALVEARQAFAPMIVLTADRPVELSHCGANQAIDQLKLYGDHAVAFFELGLADPAPQALLALRRTAAQAVAASRWPLPGGVHLNLRFRKPLEPSADTEAVDAWTAAARERPVTAFEGPALEPQRPTVEALARSLEAAERPLVVCGPQPMVHPVSLAALDFVAAASGAPIFAEAASQLRFRSGAASTALRVDALDTLLRSGLVAELSPDLVLQIGAAPTSGACARFLRAASEKGCAHIAVSAHGWPDPGSTVSQRIAAEPCRLVAALAEQLTLKPVPNAAWVGSWQRAEALMWQMTDAFLAQRDSLSEAATVRAATAALSAGSILALGNSLPVRLVDAWIEGSRIAAGVSVLHQRGASGIDGLVSAAAGAAAGASRPTLLVLGDVSLLHDIGGLAVARAVAVPLVILVVENGGGRIFDQLPIAAHPAARDQFDHWRTPPQVDFSYAARAFGIPFTRASDPATLESALDSALGRPGPTLVEAAVPPGGAAEDFAALRRAVGEAGR